MIRQRVALVLSAAALTLTGCSQGSPASDASQTSAAAEQSSGAVSVTPSQGSAAASTPAATGSATASPTGQPVSCHYLVDKDVTSDGDIHVGNFFALAQWPAGQGVTGLWWSPYGEDKGEFAGSISAGRLVGTLAVEHIEGGTFETVDLSKAWKGSGTKATIAGYKAVSASAFHTYVSGTGFLFSPCM